MPDAITSRRTTAAAVLSILLLACIALAACGSSSSSTTSSSANAASTGTASTGSSSTGTSSTGANVPAPPAGRIAGRFAAIRECLQKNGITLPKRAPGTGRPGGGAGLLAGGSGAGAPQLPKGVTRAQYEAALKKCGGGVRFGGSGRIAQNPAFKTALTKYAECLRQNGVNVPPPNLSGKGPVFSTKGINTTSPQFKAATLKCRQTLLGAFRNLHGNRGPNGASAAPGGAPAGGASPG